VTVQPGKGCWMRERVMKAKGGKGTSREGENVVRWGGLGEEEI